MPRVPSQVNLEAMKKQARDLLRVLRQRDVAALRRYHCVDPLAGLSKPNLADAQYVIAHEYGYSSWKKLQRQFAGHVFDHPLKGALRVERHEVATPNVKPPIESNSLRIP